MPNKKARIGGSQKFYYITFAIADFIDVFNSWFLWVFLSDSLYMWTEGKFTINVVTSSSFACKAMIVVWTVSEIYSDYAVTAFTIERLIALFFPLKSKAILTMKFSIILVAIIVIPMWLSIVPLIPFVANLMYNPGTSATGMHCTRDKSHPFYGYYAFMFNAVTNMIHEILNTALVVFLLLGIIKCNNARKKLVHADSSANLLKIINSSLTVFSL